jgi:hypothetical protein
MENQHGVEKKTHGNEEKVNEMLNLNAARGKNHARS